MSLDEQHDPDEDRIGLTPRQLKRLEQYLRVVNDVVASTLNEREQAGERALEMVIAARAGLPMPGEEWTSFVTMRRLECELCDEEIKPAERAWKNDREERRHDKCHREKADL